MRRIYKDHKLVSWKLNSTKHEKPLKIQGTERFHEFWKVRKDLKTYESNCERFADTGLIWSAEGALDRTLWRVWSWLRTNAGGTPNTCKSNGDKDFGFYLSGGRVSNTWATCLWERDSFWKRMVIPHNIAVPHDTAIKDLSLRDGLASD